jgi:hypothetical protein
MLSKTRSEIDIDRGDKDWPTQSDISFDLASDTMKEDAEIVDLALYADGQLMAPWRASINTHSTDVPHGQCITLLRHTQLHKSGGSQRAFIHSFIHGAAARQPWFDCYKSARSTSGRAWQLRVCLHCLCQTQSISRASL